jgi:hypothetical protein
MEYLIEFELMQNYIVIREKNKHRNKIGFILKTGGIQFIKNCIHLIYVTVKNMIFQLYLFYQNKNLKFILLKNI